MPTYTLKNTETDETWEVICSWSELEEKVKEPNIIQVPSSPRIVSGVGGLLSKTDNGWKENLDRIKKGSGRGNTIKL